MRQKNFTCAARPACRQAGLPRRPAGVTLTELLIIVSIISILAVIAISLLASQIFKGNDAKRKTEVRRIQVAVEEYEKDHECYPLPQYVVCKPGTGLKPYISKIPCDPVTGGSYVYEHADDTCPSWYRIYVRLENEADPDIEELECTYGCGPGFAYNYYVSSPNAPAPARATAPLPSGDGDGGDGGDGEVFYGCFGGVCTMISWDPERPGPECDPNFQNPTCYGQCGPAEVECQPWQ